MNCGNTIMTMKKLIFPVIILLFILLFGNGSFILSTLSLHGAYSVSSASDIPEYALEPFPAYLKTILKSNGYASVRCASEVDVNNFVRSVRAEKIKEETFDDFHTAYYYSPVMSGTVPLGDHKVNLQIVWRDDAIIVGTPLVGGSY